MEAETLSLTKNKNMTGQIKRQGKGRRKKHSCKNKKQRSLRKDRLILGYIFPHNFGRRYTKKIPRLSRNCPFYHDYSQLIVYLNNLQLSNFCFGSSHPPRHLFPGVHTSRSCSSTNRTQGSVALRTMSHRPTMKVVSFDTTLESLADGVAGDVDEITLLEDFVEDQPLSGLEPLHGLEAELLEVAHGDGPGLVEVAELGLGELAVPDTAVSELHGLVAVGGCGLDLGDDVALAESDDGDGDDGALGLEVGHHP